ncbi:hypothetical protein D3C87_1546140 [compost metagenome]
MHLGVIPGQAPLAHCAVAATAELQGGRGLVFQFDRIALGTRGRASACGESHVGAVDQRPGVRRFHRAAEIAEQLQVGRQLIAQPHARGVVPIAQAGLAARFGVGHRAFSAGIEGGEAGGQPQVVGDLQIIAHVQHGVRTLIGEVANVRARRVTGGVAGGNAHLLAGAGVGQVLGHAQARCALALQAPEGIATLVIERAADIGVRDLQAVRTFA